MSVQSVQRFRSSSVKTKDTVLDYKEHILNSIHSALKEKISGQVYITKVHIARDARTNKHKVIQIGNQSIFLFLFLTSAERGGSILYVQRQLLGRGMKILNFQNKNMLCYLLIFRKNMYKAVEKLSIAKIKLKITSLSSLSPGKV